MIIHTIWNGDQLKIPESSSTSMIEQAAIKAIIANKSKVLLMISFSQILPPEVDK